MPSFSRAGSLAVDLINISTIVGVWPRYIEPKLLKKTYLKWKLPSHHKLKGTKIVHFTDLHIHAATSPSFLKRLSKAILKENPALIVFTGDFLCYSRLDNPSLLKEFLGTLKASLGSFCVFGNHDYSKYVSRDFKGNYVTKTPVNPLLGAYYGLRTVFAKEALPKGVITDEVKALTFHEELLALLKKTPFQPLENTSTFLPQGLNIVGLGEYGLGRTHPKKAFAAYDKNYPGLILVHNPDALAFLLDQPGEMILAGHTHGEQIHFPFPKSLRNLSRKLVRIENQTYTRGLFHLENNKKLYVNRGIASFKPFRLGSPPEILVIEVDDE